MTGLGGGGAMYSPSVSPHDRLLMFVSCDMGGFYRSEDGGRAWRMLDADQMRASTRCRPVFHPRDPNVVYTYGGDALKVSEDRGVTWRRLTASPPWREEVVELGIDPGAPDRMFAGTDRAAYVSIDGGRTWSACAGVTGAVRGFHVDATSPEAGRVCFIGASDGVFRSEDGGRTWTAKSAGLPWRDLRGFCGATDPATGLTALTCTIPSRAVDGRFAGGVFRSLNGGESWQSAMGEGINIRLGKVDEYGDGDIAQYYLAATAQRTPNTVYVTNSGTGYWPPYHFTVYRTDDGGGTWRAVYQGDPRFSNPNVAVGWLVYETNWGYGGRHTPSGFNVNRGDVDRAMYTNLGEVHITEDGGRTWFAGYTRRVSGQGAPGKGQRWSSVGLEVTSVWDYVFDPHDRNRTYIAYTDIGFARSEDRGETWYHAVAGSPWRNTFYDLVCDPARPGVLYAAASDQHDIPHWTNIETIRPTGGVVMSTDSGKTWRTISGGLPQAPATSLCIDPTSPPDNRTIYVALMGQGVYRTTDGGRTWAQKSNGLGGPGNLHTWLVRRTSDGTLYCTVTGKRQGLRFDAPGGLYRSRDGGESWQIAHPGLDLHWAGGFDVHPKDPNTIFLTASTAPQRPEGGLYRTRDGGGTWTRVIRDGDLPGTPGYIQAFFVRIDPERPERVYFSTEAHGLFVSQDGGDRWERVKGLPFRAVQRVAFDPEDPDRIWVSTFGGGVWTGPALGSP
ncbi:MAG: hypothetical protein A3F84_06355 [Candidatus Handelsmanbacteria bacterium RIFCSPLOWO2_12_FULL_64_10]|uniref:Sortilin N-terminal domain-containing protein n=1 Tax=Handelsmanbacteria sp. (strain RIFCSPLOWO2_12_FULL_64_10) TaxID=1817868 RepID=A0A1F6C8D6_HANXR|nr:MAG: hypothetical protein A3F84_06355 [Candidatus Handelsmanbacteria bacterium RIFCSPLOWO2_12_FULL_64_10]